MKKPALVVALFLATCWLSYGQSELQKPPQAPGTSKDQPYTIVDPHPKFLQEKDPEKRIKMMDDFLSKQPPAALLPYVYPSYYQAYWELKNYLKVMEYADKFMSLGDSTDAAVRYQALFAWSMAYNQLSSEDPRLAANARLRTAAAMKVLWEIKKPQDVDDRTWAEQKSKVKIYLLATSGRAAVVLKDYSGADEAFKSILELTPSASQPER